VRIIKLDRRHALSHKWKYALHFGTRTHERKHQLRYARGFMQIYGPSYHVNEDRAVLDTSKPFWIFNDNWYRDDKRGRIYFNNESDITAIELIIA